MSSSAQESLPPSRSSTSESAQQGPIPLFDFQLRVLMTSYLNFFEERKKIEETYIDSLLKLHRKAKSIDMMLNDRGEPSTARNAWNEIRDNVERDAHTRGAFLETLTVDVVNPLTMLKDTQDRTRKRIKEDLKESLNAYTDYSENMLPKLKRSYLKKCQDVEDYKAAAAQNAQQPGQAASHGEGFNSKSHPNGPSRPVVTSPQPLRPLDRRPSGSAPPARNRSPSSGTAFSDLAHQGKKQFNQLITFLDKSGTVKEGLAGRSDPNNLRAVRAKREADEADKEYRKGVHWLETLRLRRIKILEGGFKSLEMFMYESAATVRQVLEKYTDNMTATTMTQAHLASHARSVVDTISPEKDASVLASHIPRALASSIPNPVLYYNYHVGECSDLIFGVSLADYATTRGLPDGEIPKLVRLCIREIDKRGLESEGIYRVSGRHAVVQELQHKVERNERAFEFNPLTDDVYAISSLLKLYLRELPEPLFKFPLQERLQHSEDKAEHVQNNFVLLRSKLRRLPVVHQATLKAVVEHLGRVAALTEKNKMDTKNLAIVFGGVIFGEDEVFKGIDLLSVQSFKDTLMEDLIIHATVLFDDSNLGHSPTSHSPPLPAAPAGETPPSYPYGSSHTKVASVTIDSRSPGLVTEDFTPKLPPRPTNSIHPSQRANPISPVRSEFPQVPTLRTRPNFKPDDIKPDDDKYLVSPTPLNMPANEEGSELLRQASRPGRHAKMPSPSSSKPQPAVPFVAESSTAEAALQASLIPSSSTEDVTRSDSSG